VLPKFRYIIPFIIVLLITILTQQALALAKIYPQFGFNSYVGPNNLFSITPWAGFRLSMSNYTSLILKFNQQYLTYNYYNWEGQLEKIEKKISHLVGVFYLQKNRLDLYAAIVYLIGEDSYTGVALDAGLSYRLFSRLRIEGGIYLLTEKSNLWYPDEDVRNIRLSSFRLGLQYKIFKRLTINPKIFFATNSEDVSASAYSLGIIWLITNPLYLTVDYTRYSESQLYKFSGNYVNIGLNVYF
jgi:hypothetical protein